jgi:peptidoglycan/xylan/chitin deacetylase (PgdA/CDA1 family)
LYNTFDFLMNTAEQHGITTAFFLYAGDGAHPLDPDYRLDDVFIENLCQRISERGHEIAAHPGYDRYCNATATVRDVSRLREMVQRTTGISEIRGSRQHYLRWSPEASWRNLAAAGLQYDATLGFNDRLGFRCGTCWEFPVYDLYRRQPIQLRERPLLFMDVTLLRHQAMGIAEIVDAANALADTCRRYGGDFTLLWHNNFLTTAALRDGYRSIVANAAVGT